MFKKYWILLLIGHLLGDFYIQTEQMAERKNSYYKWVILHGISYWGSMLIVHIPIWSHWVFLTATLAAGTHLAIDSLKFLFLKKYVKKNKITKRLERDIFFGDQMLHALCLMAIAYSSVRYNANVQVLPIIKEFFGTIGISGFQTLMWCAALLLIHKPSNIAIQKLLTLHKPEVNKKELKSDNNAGRFVGTVERLIMLLLLSVEQYSAMGLVLTAKSIARYDKISKDQNFAEYYLLGTLLSVGIVIIVSLLI